MWSTFSIEHVDGNLTCKGTFPKEGTPVLVLSNVYDDHISNFWSPEFLETIYTSYPKEDVFTWIALPNSQQPLFEVGDSVAVTGEVVAIYEEGYLFRLGGNSSFHIRKDIFEKAAKKG